MNFFKKLLTRKRQKETTPILLSIQGRSSVPTPIHETEPSIKETLKLRNVKWKQFDSGKLTGTSGSEGGKIITDFENLTGARLTIEKDGNIAPYTVTLGIYGLMFHTHFCSTKNEADVFSNSAMEKIDKIFLMYEIQEADRDNSWREQHNKLVAELAEQ